MKKNKLRIDKFTVAKLNHPVYLTGGTQVEHDPIIHNETTTGTETDDKKRKEICISDSDIIINL